MSEMLLVIKLAGRTAVLPASAIDCVVELDRVVPVPRAPAHVVGLAALRSRPMTVIDCRAALGLELGMRTSDHPRAVVVEHARHLYGLLVDTADDIVRASAPPSPLGADPGASWSRVASGMVETEVGALLLLDIGAIVTGMVESAEL